MSEEMGKLTEKAEMGDKYFRLWWIVNGSSVEVRWGIDFSKKELAGQAFVAGYIAGFNQGQKEK